MVGKERRERRTLFSGMAACLQATGAWGWGFIMCRDVGIVFEYDVVVAEENPTRSIVGRP